MIPVCTPALGKKEEKYLLNCVRENWISSSGRYINDFEREFSRFCGCQYGITTVNGTAALHLALAAINLGPRDEVIMPSFTIASTAFAVLYCSGRPVLVDSDPATWNMDTSQFKKKITKRTKAIMPVHIYGNPCDMDTITKLARKYGLYVIEDAAEAHGAIYKSRVVGGIGDIGCFSFYGNKVITCGEGGMVVTNNRRLAERCRSLKNLAFIEKRRFWHEEIGFNYRMTNMQAALGLAQFERIDTLIAKRRENAQRYNFLLSSIEGLTLPMEKEDTRNVYWMYGILVDKTFGCSRDQLMKRLLQNGIETRTFFWPMHMQPVLRKMGLFMKEKYPVAEDIARRGLYLPSGSNLKPHEIEYICMCIRKIQKTKK